MDSNPYLPGSAAAANAGMLSHDDKSGNDFDFSIPSDLSPDNGGAPTEEAPTDYYEEAPTDYYEEAPTDHLDGVPTGNRTTLLPELGSFLLPEQEQSRAVSPGGSLNLNAFLSGPLLSDPLLSDPLLSDPLTPAPTPAPPTQTHPGLAPPGHNLLGPPSMNYAANSFYPTAQNPYPPQQSFTSVSAHGDQMYLPSWQPPLPDNRYTNGYVQTQNTWNTPMGQVPQPNRFPDNTQNLLYGAQQPSRNYSPVTGHYVSSVNYDSDSETLGNENNNNQINPGDKISYARGDKANKLKIADPSKFYTKPMEMPQPWEIDGTTFSYDAYGHLTSGLTFNADQLRNYFEYCPRQLRLWVQHHPAQCNSRMIGRDHSCRYSGCPVLSKNIGPGWHRVVFDEYSLLTKNGDKDPFHIAGAMHLWCFERCFDPAQYYHKGALRPDVRVLPKEEKNPMALNRHPDKHIVEQTFMPWIKRQLKIGPQMMPRPEEESLSQALFNHHLTAQSVTRQMTRDKRFNKKQTKVKKTADCHKGNLGLWVAENNKEREQKRLEKQVTKEMMMAHGMNANTNLFGNNTAARMAQGANDETIPAPSMQLLAQATYPEDRLLMPPPPPRGSDVSSSSDGRGSSGPDVRGKKLVGKKRARNDGEDDDSDSDSDCDCLPDPSDEFAGPRIYKRAHKRVRISEGDEADAGLRKFNEMLKRRAGELGCRRRTWCSGDDPRRLQRGILA
ncbi:hypothetical protein BGZ61DRAFT_544470 [Ilyonectria robusta]|uniref:uncharacterized protein n=1 Tax=Ilyonectria robusta TaxID=1079257 RepID=UPI001E8CE4AC|nr:uncharacterized protein BGZ61DRAFT_544470 [Ilyonectria robusta]KAH8738130.1 hypothetical protein BGZ61DRAFT_544470 [Ilyonectria robusta]